MDNYLDLNDVVDDDFNYSELYEKVRELFQEFDLPQVLFVMQEYCENNLDCTFDAQIKGVEDE